MKVSALTPAQLFNLFHNPTQIYYFDCQSNEIYFILSVTIFSFSLMSLVVGGEVKQMGVKFIDNAVDPSHVEVSFSCIAWHIKATIGSKLSKT